MYRFWEIIIEDVLDCLSGQIVEIGADRGKNTRKLLRHCTKKGNSLIVIEPYPQFDKATLEQEIGGHFTLYQQNSLDILPELTDLTAVLIDGDHNWYTVYHELQAIEKNHPQAETFPVILLHDLNWPYGHRDLYYQPDIIPAEFRHPHQQSGIRYGEKELWEDYKFNHHLHNATGEGGSRNGVLTALEDFIAQSQITFELLQFPIFYGLGILVSAAVLDQNKALNACWQRFQSHTFSLELLEETERLRAIEFGEMMHKNQLLWQKLGALQTQIEHMQTKPAQTRSWLGRLRDTIRRSPQKTAEDFLCDYYNSWVWFEETKWLGVSAKKCPMDMWIYQELIYRLKPDLVIETGTYDGGSTLFIASILELCGKGKIISIDIKQRETQPSHPRIQYIEGSSTDKQVVNQVYEQVRGKKSILVILDSDHTKDHVLQEMETYSKWVTVGSYLIVEDTIVNGHPVLPDFGPGPMEAVKAFLSQHPEFKSDRSLEKFRLTFNQRGYLQRVW